MRVLYVDAPDAILEQRRRLGLDRRDEVWEGVYHIVPPPSGEHQEVVDDLFVLFRCYIREYQLGRMRSNTGVRGGPDREQDYCIPEWVFLKREREDLLRSESGFVDDGPDVVLEVRSPGDETYEKIPFYEAIGVRELLLVDRDSRDGQVLRRVGGKLVPMSPNIDGWVTCEGLRAFFRRGEVDGKPRLLVRLERSGAEHAV
jgi:Uma2 family endonuclease